MPIALLVAAAIGYLIGGIPGLILLGGLAWVVGRSRPLRLLRNLASVQGQFLDSAFAVMGALCKADGVVTRDEIRVAEELFERMHLGPEPRQRAQAAFNRGKAQDFDLDAELHRFVSVCGRHAGLMSMFLSIQLSAVAADGRLDGAEHALLMRVARGLHMSEAELLRLEAMLGGSGGSGPGVDVHAPSLDSAYQVLGVRPDASDAEVKKAYRRLMNQHHPDKLASRGLPESMREMAEEKTREIGAAWERIEQARRGG